jgi:hypothetical protein
MKHRLAALALALCAVPNMSLAWGNTGHRLVGQAAMKGLPREIPAFLRTPAALVEVGELSREPDRSKAAGKLHDSEREPGHFIDLGEDGHVLNGPSMVPLSATREDYDTAMRAVGSSSWKGGYLPYAIIDRRQQLSLDFAYWRILVAAEANPKWKANRAWFHADRIRREALILKTLGELSHFVGDGSQPLHVTKHFNGWGDYPNPQEFTKARIHSPFESDLVQSKVTLADVTTRMRPLKVCDCGLDKRTGDYLLATGALVIPLYEMEKTGGMTDGRLLDMAETQLGVGASELRDVVVEAWRFSATMKVGWKPVAVVDVLSGAVDPYTSLHGVD